MPPRAAPWDDSDQFADAWAEAPQKRAKLDTRLSLDADTPRRRKRRLSWGSTGPPPKLARDAAGQRAELTWELEPRSFQPEAPPGRDELALTRICEDPVPELPPLVYPRCTQPLVVVPHGGCFLAKRPSCWAARRAPLLLADRNVPRIGPPTIKLPWPNRQQEADAGPDRVATSDGVRSCWIEEIDEDADESTHAAGFDDAMDENCWEQHAWQQAHPADEMNTW